MFLTQSLLSNLNLVEDSQSRNMFLQTFVQCLKESKRKAFFSLWIIIWLSSCKKRSQHEHVTDSICSVHIQQTGNAFENISEGKIDQKFNFRTKALKVNTFVSFLYCRCFKRDECSRLACSRRTRFDYSNFICNRVHRSSDNLSKTFSYVG